MTKIKAVIIDDEALNRQLIHRLISELNSDFDVVGQAENVAKGFELISTIRPDVVFLDIRMPDGTGFALLSLFETINFEIVFISGFDNYALKAFEFNALDYVVKPIDPERFSKTLSKVKAKLFKTGPADPDAKMILETFDVADLTLSKIPVHQGNMVNLLAPEEIISITSEDNYTLFKTRSENKHVSSKHLSDFDFILEQHPYLVRISKSAYINVNFVSRYSKGKTCSIFMRDGSTFEVSRRKKGEILELLTGKRQ